MVEYLIDSALCRAEERGERVDEANGRCSGKEIGKLHFVTYGSLRREICLVK